MIVYSSVRKHLERRSNGRVEQLRAVVRARGGQAGVPFAKGPRADLQGAGRDLRREDEDRTGEGRTITGLKEGREHLARAEGSLDTNLDRPKSRYCRPVDRRRIPESSMERASNDCTNCEPTTRFQTESCPSSSASPASVSLPPCDGADPTRPVGHGGAPLRAAVRILECGRRRAAAPGRTGDLSIVVGRQRQAAS